MPESKKNLKVIVILFGIALVVFGLIYGGISLTQNFGKSQKVISMESAEKKLDKLYKDITVNIIEPKKGQVDIDPPDLKESLPDISKYPPQVEETTGTFIEIFSSTEKSGEKKDGWLLDVAREFNRANIQVNGKPVSVRIRGIASGLATDYIISGKYLPDAFTPSNELWGEMIRASGVDISLVEKRLAGNVAGVLLSKAKYEELLQKYGSINLKNITEAVAANEIAMGYTNPFASSTGMNFLVSTLSTFDSKNILSEKAIEGFEKFQTNIPFVAYTTLQMRESAKSGVLDGFILEYQTYENTPELKKDYVFTPFGVRHDSPMYAIGNLTQEKKEILNKFVEFCKSSKSQELATEYGFNRLDDYLPEISNFDGEAIMKAQKLWKEKKDVNNDIVAVFVADVSGSMAGEPLNRLKQSLINGSKYISSDVSIGLVSYSTDVNINLPIAKFDLNQRSLFVGAVESLAAGGNTATFDAIIVATKMLKEEKAKNPNAKLMLFVLSDGVTNYGHSLNDIKDMMKTFGIPIYTIGYNANIKALETLSQINEAANINADTEDVVYQLGSLFNAQM
ncbi:VWA domain-containing protein [Acetivibrio thermocellus]|uniref:vWA domain-containing protein n=1 Tax=Acetivibrio thermocellus TaxID=1515 RepID=UPI0010A5B09D|nr:VWA domain-containing protein [Acetivibrio thermocellus]THJ79098.1 VWA domain-containing protein [Acetivibrio thermocellus]